MVQQELAELAVFLCVKSQMQCKEKWKTKEKRVTSQYQHKKRKYFEQKPGHNAKLPLKWHLIDQSHSRESGAQK